MPLPPKIENAPELFVGLSLFFGAFIDLSTCRFKSDSGDGPIPWVAINTYCEHHCIEGEQREDLEYFIRRMDAEYLKLYARRIKSKFRQGKGGKNGTTGPR